MIKKNDFCELFIQGNGTTGEGIGKLEDGYTVFVPMTVKGDKIKCKITKAKKRYAYAILVEIIEPSPDRVEPICPIYSKCGGCNILHMSYDAGIELKKSNVLNNLIRIGGIDSEVVTNTMEEDGVIKNDTPFYYRNKVSYPVRDEYGITKIGFYAQNSHRIIETDICYIQDRFNEKIVKVIRDFMVDNNVSAYNERKNEGLIRHIVIRRSYKLDEFQVVLVINGNKLPNDGEFVKKLVEIEDEKKVSSVCLNINKTRSNVILGEKVISIYGEEYITDFIEDLEFKISPLSFYQVNPPQTVKLYNKALEYADLTGNETVFDLYCGIGTISLFLARKAAKVYGVEILDKAIEDAKANAEINNIENIEFLTGRSEEVAPKLYADGVAADVVVLDPARKGCEESLLAMLTEMKPEKIVYISCDSGTLARDLKFLCNDGYKLEKWSACDMFSGSWHVETVVKLVRA